MIECRSALRYSLALTALLVVTSASAQTPGFQQQQMPQAQANGPAVDWVTFREPSEGAYTVEIPQGWSAAGGLRRYAASEVPTWLTVSSPDGSIEMFLGDPSVNAFMLPTQFAAEGAQVPFLHDRPATVMRYRPGADYATLYGTRSLAAVCTNVQVRGTQPLPRLEDEMRADVQTATRLDAGEALFTCDRNGQPTTAAVQAGTLLATFPGGGGVWAPVAIRGYVAPTAIAPQIASLLAHVAASFKLDPQFEAAIKQAGKEEEERSRQQAAQRPAPLIPSIQQPVAPVITPYISPRRAGPVCDDLQQQRICNMNDGHLVVTNGCLKCI